MSTAGPMIKEGPRRALVLVPGFTLYLTFCVNSGRWHNLSVGLCVHTPERVIGEVSVNKDDATSYGGSTLLEDFEEKVSFLYESKYRHFGSECKIYT